MSNFTLALLRCNRKLRWHYALGHGLRLGCHGPERLGPYIPTLCLLVCTKPHTQMLNQPVGLGQQNILHEFDPGIGQGEQ